MPEPVPSPDGHNTHPPAAPTPPPAGGTNAGVTNQNILALDPSTFHHLHRYQAHALNIVQLEFARDVARRTAEAYERTLDVLGPANAPVAGA